MSDADALTGSGAIAAAFVTARREARALDRYPGEIPATLDAAYRIQDAAIRLVDDRICGWKVGRIQPPLDQHFGTTRLSGPIFARNTHPVSPGRDMAVFMGGFGAIEAEFLFRLGTVPPGRSSWSIDDALDCVTAVHIGFEIASSPFAGINILGPTVTASDFGNNNGLLIGPAVADWRERHIDRTSVTTIIDDAFVGSGQASSFPGGSAQSVAFLLENLTARGHSVVPGTWVSTGAVSGVHEIAPGSTAIAQFGDFGSIECHIVAALAETSSSHAGTL
jgi:2-keto-4-pentenoate hydratase